MSKLRRCPAVCRIGDGDENGATMHCQLGPNHTGPHRELFREGSCLIFWRDDGGRALDGLTLEELIRLVSGPIEEPKGVS